MLLVTKATNGQKFSMVKSKEAQETGRTSSNKMARGTKITVWIVVNVSARIEKSGKKLRIGSVSLIEKHPW